MFAKRVTGKCTMCGCKKVSLKLNEGDKIYVLSHYSDLAGGFKICKECLREGLKAIKALEQKPTKKEPNEDCK